MRARWRIEASLDWIFPALLAAALIGQTLRAPRADAR
jgi:hypothetical protein